MSTAKCGTQLLSWMRETGPTSDSPSVTYSFQSGPSTAGTPPQTYVDGGKSGNAADRQHRKRRKGWICCSLPMSDSSHRSHISSTWYRSCRRLAMNFQHWLIMSGRRGVSGRGCCRCWKGRGRILGYWGCLYRGGSVSTSLWVRDVGYVPTHW